jgi:5-formyltetrahydrofolate cyclo-ligase
MDQVSVKTQKAALRKTAKARLEALGSDYRKKASRTVCEALIELVKKQAFKRVFCYFGQEPEVLTEDFLRYCLCNNLELYIPFCAQDRRLEFYRIFDLNLSKGTLGIPEPEPSGLPEPANEGDLMVVPGLAFGRDLTRLGRGAGYYDRFLENCGAKKAGLCFDSVLFDSLPHDMYDISMDMLITEMEVAGIVG